jgi:hypothetical protein
LALRNDVLASCGAEDKPCRLHVHLFGVEAYVYNATGTYEHLRRVAQMRGMESNPC